MGRREVSVLVVEDSPGDANFIREMLLNDPNVEFCVKHCETLSEGLQRIKSLPKEAQIDVALLDLGLPDSLGLDTFRAFHREVPELPVVILSGSTDESEAMAAVQEGAQDFVPKGRVTPELLRKTLSYSIERHRLARRLQHMANHDQLTGAFNRHSFSTWIKEETSRACRYKHPISFVVLDIDRFKVINDRFGHAIGDCVLQVVARELRCELRTVDRVFRLGGDEFLVVLPETDDAEENVQQRLHDAIVAGLKIEKTIPVPPSITLATECWRPESDTSPEEVIHQADLKMYALKTKKSLSGFSAEVAP